MELTVKYVAGMVDHTNLHADATKADFVKLADEAKKYGFKSLAINTYPVTLCRELCEGSKVRSEEHTSELQSLKRTRMPYH